MGTLKDQVADVSVIQTDLALDVGRWVGGACSNATTAFSFTGTAAFTVIDWILFVTAAASNGTTAVIGTVATPLMGFIMSSAVTFRCIAHGDTAAGTTTTTMTTGNSISPIEIAALGTFTLNFNTPSGTFAGKMFICYIATP